MIESQTMVDMIVDLVCENFRTFGGSKAANDNPIDAAMVGKPPMFAAGVDVREVVTLVMLETAEQILKEMTWVK